MRNRLTAALAAVVVMSGGVAGSAGAAEGPAWHLTPVPENKITSNLVDVAATDAEHAWAVGLEGFDPDRPHDAGAPLFLRWDGDGWSRGSLPPVPVTTSFRHVAASSPSDVWVVGGPRSSTGTGVVTLVWHYDGEAWTEVPYPAGVTPSDLTIRDVSAVDGRVWLVGYRDNKTVLHEWTGAAWLEHRPPAECTMGGFPNFCNFVAVKAFAPDDVWAAGNGWWPGFMGPLLYHWNGTAWRAVQVGVNQQQLVLHSLDGRSSKEIWAVGDGAGFGSGNIVVHGDGTSWKQVPGAVSPYLPDVAVGADGAPWVTGTSPLPTFSTHRAGAWSFAVAPVPPGTQGVSYNAIAAVPGTDRIIAVGSTGLPGTSPRRVQAVIAEYS